MDRTPKVSLNNFPNKGSNRKNLKYLSQFGNPIKYNVYQEFTKGNHIDNYVKSFSALYAALNVILPVSRSGNRSSSERFLRFLFE